MDDTDVSGTFLLNYFKTARTIILAQQLSLIIAMLFSKSSRAFKLRRLSIILSFPLLPIVIVELFDRIIHNDKADVLHLAILYFDWVDLFVFTVVFVGSSIGAFIVYGRNEKAKRASEENEKEQP